MDPRQLFVDERLAGGCVYCGKEPNTRDHVPPRVMLDEPYPTDLPVVPACEECNEATSLDEQYLACLVDCAISGSPGPDRLQREEVRRMLSEAPGLQKRLAACRQDTIAGGSIWRIEEERIQRVVLKLARGHAAYQLRIPQLAVPKQIEVNRLADMSILERRAFETLPDERAWPELGGRIFVGVAADGAQYPVNGWFEVQPGRYRYAVTWSHGVGVRVVLSEYLACKVTW